MWQLAQLPRVCEWSKRLAGSQADVVWHPTQFSGDMMWSDVFGVAPIREPGEWQVTQTRGVPLNTASTWHDSQGCSRCAPVSSKPVVRWSNLPPGPCAKAAPPNNVSNRTQCAISFRMVDILVTAGVRP